MQKREKLLAAVVGGLVLLLIVYLGVGRIWSSFSDRTTRIKGLKAELHEKKTKETRGQAAADQLAEWEHRSLPTNQESARTLYQNWLVQLADKSKLANVTIDAQRGGMHRAANRNIYYKLPFTVRARGSLNKVVQFMHDFYGANHLHQMREVSLNPIEKSSDLDLNFVIEALVLPGADRDDELNDETATRLAWTGLKDYEEVIVKRNFFAPYSPPRPPPPPVADQRPTPPKPPGFDPAKYAVLTAILEVEGVPEAWFSVRTTGELLKLEAGQKLEVGQFKGKLTRINLSDVELESDGKRRQLALGKSLPQAVVLGAVVKEPEPAKVPAAVSATEPTLDDKAAQDGEGAEHAATPKTPPSSETPNPDAVKVDTAKSDSSKPAPSRPESASEDSPPAAASGPPPQTPSTTPSPAAPRSALPGEAATRRSSTLHWS